MRTLVADISNGRTKLALAERGCLITEVRTLPTAALSVARLEQLCRDWRFGAAVVASVVPAADEDFRRFAALRGGVYALGATDLLPVDFAFYPGRATLGADRVANAVAAAACHPGEPLVVMDAGTATTLDVVLPAGRAGEKARFLGGAIAPGVGTLVRALHGNTAQLPEVSLALPARAVGRDTVEAMQNGCVRGYCGLVREVLASMAEECGQTLLPVLTGGDAPLLAKLMPELGEPDPLLTLRGIALCGGNAGFVNFS